MSSALALALPSPSSHGAVLERPGRRRGGAWRHGTPSASRAALVSDFLSIAALDPAVDGLRAPAAAGLFRFGDEAIEHAADFELLREGEAPTLVDVAEDLRDHPLRAALVAGDALVAEDGRVLDVETAMTLRAEPRLTNVRLIMACRRVFVAAGDRVRILHHLDECGTGRLVDCAGAVQTAADGVAAVLALAVEGLVAVDIRGPLAPETPVRRRRLPPVDPFGF